MSDPELEAIRQQRLAQLQSQYKVNYYCIIFDKCNHKLFNKNINKNQIELVNN